MLVAPIAVPGVAVAWKGMAVIWRGTAGTGMVLLGGYASPTWVGLLMGTGSETGVGVGAYCVAWLSMLCGAMDGSL